MFVEYELFVGVTFQTLEMKYAPFEFVSRIPE
jgi:hypothetical protein